MFYFILAAGFRCITRYSWMVKQNTSWGEQKNDEKSLTLLNAVTSSVSGISQSKAPLWSRTVDFSFSNSVLRSIHIQRDLCVEATAAHNGSASEIVHKQLVVPRATNLSISLPRAEFSLCERNAQKNPQMFFSESFSKGNTNRKNNRGSMI